MLRWLRDSVLALPANCMTKKLTSLCWPWRLQEVDGGGEGGGRYFTVNPSILIAGQFGFEKEMNALGSLKDPAHKYERGLSDVDVLLGATLEVENRMQGPQRAWQIWRKDLWFGRYLLKRYNVRRHLLSPPPPISHPPPQPLLPVIESAWRQYWGLEFRVPRSLLSCGHRHPFAYPGSNASVQISWKCGI